MLADETCTSKTVKMPHCLLYVIMIVAIVGNTTFVTYSRAFNEKFQKLIKTAEATSQRILKIRVT
jgi:N-dimethylarginine dimethylaminohydrolase